MKITCKKCHVEYELNVTNSQLLRHNLGELAQTAFSNLNEDERELLISGICGKCYDELFIELEDDLC